MYSGSVAHCLLYLFLGFLEISAETNASKFISRAKRQCCMQMAACCGLPQQQQQQPVSVVPLITSHSFQPTPVIQQEKQCDCHNLLTQMKLCDCQLKKCDCTSAVRINCNCAALQEQYANCGCGPLNYDVTCKCSQQRARCVPACMPDCSHQCLDQQQIIFNSQNQELQTKCTAFCMPLCEQQCVKMFESNQMHTNIPELQSVIPQLHSQSSFAMQSESPYFLQDHQQSFFMMFPPGQSSLPLSIQPCPSNCASNCPSQCNTLNCCQMCHNLPPCSQPTVSQSQHAVPVQLQQSRCVAKCMPNCEPQCIQQACPPACQPMCEPECMHKLRSQVIVLAQQQSQLPQFLVQPHLFQLPSQPQLPRFPSQPVQPSVHALRPPPQPQLPQTHCVQQCMPQCLQECVQKACVATCGPACLPECMEQQKKVFLVTQQHQQQQQQQQKQCAKQCQPECDPKCIEQACVLACHPMCDPQCTQQQKPLVVTTETLQIDLLPSTACLSACMPDCLPNCLREQQQMQSTKFPQYCPQICQPTCNQQCIEQQQICSQTCLSSCQSSCNKNARCMQKCTASCERSCMDFTQQISHTISPIKQHSPEHKIQGCGINCKAMEPLHCVPQCQPTCMKSCIEQQTSGQYQQPQPFRDCMQQQSPQGCSCMIGYTHCSQNTCCLRRRRRHVS